jgi:hypothetical protein
MCQEAQGRGLIWFILLNIKGINFFGYQQCETYNLRDIKEGSSNFLIVSLVSKLTICTLKERDLLFLGYYKFS